MRKKRRYGIILIAICMILGVTRGEEDLHTVSVGEGIFARKVGLVGMISHYDRINIMLQIPEFLVAEETAISMGRCMEYPTSLVTAFKDLRNQREKFVADRLSVLKEYSITASQKQKRSVLSWLGVVGNLAYTTFMGGLSQVQIRKLNAHLQETREEVKGLAEEMSKRQEAQVMFREKTVGIIHDIAKTWNRQYTYLECKVDLAINVLDGKMSFQLYKELVDSVLYPALSGRNQVVLTSSMLDINILRHLVKNHPVFASSEFADNPALLYSTSYLSLVGVNEDITLSHHVLEFPVFKRGYNTLYEVRQVGLHTAHGNCVFFKLPDNVIRVGNSMKEVTLDSCNRHHSLHLCPQNAFNHLESCYQPDKLTCDQTQEKCASSLDYIRADTGLLFRTNANEEVFYKDTDSRIRSIKLSQFNTAYVSWNKARLVQIENVTLMSPGIDVDNITLTNFSTPIRWTESDKMVQGLATSLNKVVAKYGADIETLVGSSLDGVKHVTKDHDSLTVAVILAYGLIGVIYISTILVIVIMGRHTIYRICKACNCCASAVTNNDEEIERQSNVITEDRTYESVHKIRANRDHKDYYRKRLSV